MFSGGNSNREGLNNIKQFGPFNGMHNTAASSSAAAAAAAGPGGIDWAQLAQQWIQMRDNSSNINMEPQDYGIPSAPPPPIISTMPAYQTTKTSKPTYEEKGEADMEMDEEIDNEKHSDNDSVPPPAPTVTQSQWYSAGNSPETANNSNSQWNVWPPRVSVPPPGGTPVPVTHTATNPTAHIPSLLKINVTNPNDSVHQHSGNDNSNNGLDASKRQKLPAWIREGLEKMEREKQRQLERQQSSSSKESFHDKPEQSKIAQEANTPVILLNVSNVASESESGNEEDHYDEMNRKHTTQTDGEPEQAGDVAATAERSFATRAAINARLQKKHVIGKSYEQKLADLMIVVRRTLTELLLETTNEEIASVAHDALKSHRAKASSAQVIRKSALSSITGKLGLAAYADSSSDESSAASDSEDDAQNDKGKIDIDSEEELKATIRNKRRAFAKTIDEIEERVALAEQREEQQLKYFRKLEQERAEVHKRKYDEYESAHSSKKKTVGGASNSRGSGGGGNEYARDFGETTTTSTDSKLQQFNGKRVNRKERTTRFSDNKDGKSLSLAATTSYLSHMQQVSNSNGTSLGAGGSGNGVQINSNQKPLPVPNPATALLQMPESVAHYAANNSSMVNMLSAADAALEKAAAVKVKTSRGQKNKRRRRQSSDESSSSSSSSSTDDDDSHDSNDRSSSSSSSTSHQSKHSRKSSSKRHRRRSYNEDVADKYYHRQSSTNSSGMRGYRDSGGSSKYKHSRDDNRDHRRRDRHASSSSKRSHRHNSSDSDEHDRRSSSKRHTHGKRRSRTRSRSRSRSTYSTARSSHRKRR